MLNIIQVHLHFNIEVLQYNLYHYCLLNIPLGSPNNVHDSENNSHAYVTIERVSKNIKFGLPQIEFHWP